MKSTVLALLIAAASLPNARGEEAKAPVYRMLDKIDFKRSSIEAARSMFKPFLEQMGAQGLPDEAMAEISEAADRLFEKTYSDPGLMEEVAQAYSGIFTDEEIEELILFYDTPLGRKTLLTMPRVMQECAEIGMRHAQEHQAAFQEELAEIMRKHQPAAEEDDFEETPDKDSGIQTEE